MNRIDTLSFAPLLTQPRPMREAFQHEFAPYAGGDWLVLACEVRQARRRVSRRAEAGDAPYLDLCYRLELVEREGQRSRSQWWVAQAYRQDMAARAFESAQAAATPAGAPAFLPALGLVLWPLPHDPGLPTLPRFLDPTQVGSVLASASCLPTLAAGHVNIVRHEPGEHCTARFTFAAGAPWRALYGKCFGDARWAPAWQTLSALARQGREDASAFKVPAPVACAPALQAWWQAEASGRPLVEHLHDADVRRRLATALVRLQDDGPRAERTLMPPDLLPLARKWRHKLVQAHAATADALDPVLARLETLPPAAAPFTAHGDFHCGQMLLGDDGRIALFDYDSLVAASRAHDAAHFVSHHVTDGDGPWPRRSAEALDFLEAWQAASRQAPPPAELDWMLRLMCLRKAYSFFVHQGADWQGRVDRALALARGGLPALRAEAAPTV